MDFLYTAVAILGSPLWLYRLLRTGKWRTDWLGRFGYCQRAHDDHGHQRTLLIHAVSVGEVNSIRLLVEKLRQKVDGLRIVVSVTTDTGILRAHQLYDTDCSVVRYPLDWSCCVERFLDEVRPDGVALVENEVWPNFIRSCVRRSIPVGILNARLTEHSFSWYRRSGSIARGMYSRLAKVAAQTEADARRFSELGTPRVAVCVYDTMKWDTAEIVDEVAGVDELATAMGINRTRPVVVLGSTGDSEEKLLLEALGKKLDPKVQLVFVPRKPERFDEVARILGPDVARRSRSSGALRGISDDGRIFLIDTMGELRKAYALADVVVVGRSFNGWGGSDPIEPVGLGCPVIIGPDHQNFSDVVAALVAGDGLVVAQTADQAAEHVNLLLANRQQASDLADKGRQVIRERQGATDRYAHLVLEMIGV